MKRKMIEKIPFKWNGLKASKKFSYKIDAKVEDKYILFDFYKAQDAKWVAWYRTAIGPKEFENYSYRDNIWDRKRICYKLTEDKYSLYSSVFAKEKKKYEISDEVRELAAAWFTENELHSAYYTSDLISQIENAETHIDWEYRTTAAERRYAKIQEKMKELDPLPKDFKKFLLDKAYKNNHCLFYTAEKAVCSRCGHELPAGNYKHNKEVRCPHCRKKVIAKNAERIKLPKYDYKEILVMQSLGAEIVLRYVKTCLIQDGEGKEKIEFTESVRTYHWNDLGNYRGRYIHYFNNMVGGDYWDDKMSYGMQVSYGRRSILYTGNMDDLVTIVNREWLDLMKYWSDEGITMPLKDFLQRGKYSVSIIEKLHKAGLRRYATSIVKNEWYLALNFDARELKNVLGITKPLFNWAQKTDATGKQLAILHDACAKDYGLTNEEIIELVKADIMASELKNVSKGNKLIKTLHYLQKAAGYKNIHEKYTHYRDYLSMAVDLHYDLDNDTVRYPKDIEGAHDKAVTEANEKEMDIKISKAKAKYPEIERKHNALEDAFGFKDKTYEIVAPESAGDIITEGRILHHCVGGDTYLNRHNTGSSFILFMRKVEAPKERYYTIELSPNDLVILQYFGAYDKKPDKESVDKFLEKWKQYLKRRRKKEAV